LAKILLFGQAQFGEKVLDGLLAAGHEITAACLPPDRDGRPADPLKEAAEQAGVRVVQRASYKGDEAFAEVDPGAAELAVLAYVTQIIPLPMLDAPRLASVCFHPSLLPAYRGGSAIPWQLINGETVGGVTLFRPDDGIDAGPIYLQREIEIGPNVSAGVYYYGAVFEPGVQATLEAVELLLSAPTEGATQDESIATYDPLCRDEHARVDWSAPTSEVHNLIRGCDPAPGAHTTIGGRTVRLYGSRITTTENSSEAPGTIVAIEDEGVEVVTADGTVRMAKLAMGSGKKGAKETAEAEGVAVGDCCGS
jgi:methionyl-tRNA formyltransferase